MANTEQLEIIKKGYKTWNQWRKLHPDDTIDLYKADLTNCTLWYANFDNGDLRYAKFIRAKLGGASFVKAKLYNTTFCGAYLEGACFSETDLSCTDFTEAYLKKATFVKATLNNTNLIKACLIETNFERASLNDCPIYGSSVWNVNLNKSKQSGLIITDTHEPTITVDNLEVAQFIHLMLHNKRIRHVIDTITSKVVLILGRFTPDRKAILDAIRQKLQTKNYIPVVFDFDKPQNKDLTETIMTLAGLSKYIIADITAPKSVPLESQAVVPNFMIPFVSIIQETENPFSMFADLQTKYPWALQTVSYKTKNDLLAKFDELLKMAEAKHRELQEKKLQEPMPTIPIRSLNQD